MSCSGNSLATADEYGQFFCFNLPLSADEETTISAILEIASADVHAAMAASGQCDCTLAPWANVYLRKLAILDSAVMFNCPCGNARLTDAMKQTWIAWISEQLTAIRTGQLELCDGETGSDFPALGHAEIAWTDYNGARIIMNRELRNL